MLIGTKVAVLALALLAATPAQAAWVPAAEIVNQTVRVETNNVVNRITFVPGGAARIETPGGKIVDASWTAAQGRLCLHTGGQSECVPYNQPFRAGVEITTQSDCGSSIRWLADKTNALPEADRLGERG